MIRNKFIVLLVFSNAFCIIAVFINMSSIYAQSTNQVNMKEPLRLISTRSFIKPPDFSQYDVINAKDMLLIQLVERDKVFDIYSLTKYYIFNPENTSQGFINTFQGPGQEQYCRMLTPLFNGWGLASGSGLFWFNPLLGQKGPVVCGGIYGEHLYNTKLIFMADERLCMYDIESGEFTRIFTNIESIHFFDRGKFITEAGYNNYPYIIEGELDQLTCKPLAELPVELQPAVKLFEDFYTTLQPKRNSFRDRRIRKAGEEGLYVIDGFSVWFKANDSSWKIIAKDIHVIKTFGAMPPYLPVTYLGKGKFAISKTVTPENGDMVRDLPSFPKALFVTMLIDGYTGKIVDETESKIYFANPPLNIPDRWLTSAQRKRHEPSNESLFKWNKSTKEITLKNGQKVATGQKDKFSISRSGRYLVVYREWNSDWGENSRFLNFTIIDGASCKIYENKIEANKSVIFVNAVHWLVEKGPQIHEKDINEYTPLSMNPWSDPAGDVFRIYE